MSGKLVKQFSGSLRREILLPWIIGGIIIAGIGSWLIYVTAKQSLQAEFLSRAQILTSTLNHSAMVVHSPGELQHVIQKVTAETPQVVHVIVALREGAVTLASDIAKWNGESIDGIDIPHLRQHISDALTRGQFDHHFDDDAKRFLIVSPLGMKLPQMAMAGGTGNRGAILLELDYSETAQTITGLLIRLNLTVFAAIAATVLLSYFLLSRTILRPLDTIHGAIQGQESGDRGRRSQYQADDEIGRVAQAFDRMMDTIEQTEKGLRESEERLELQVVDLRDREERLEAQSADLIALAENLNSARNELAKLNDQKDKFFSIIAHDLKSPFNALLGFSQILATQAQDMKPDQVAEYGSLVHRAADQAYKLLEDLLDWSRLQLDRMAFEPESIDIADLIETNVGRFGPAAALKNIRIDSGKLRELRIHADAHMVDTILRNLISNAIKFTAEQGTVTVSAQQSGDWAEIAVADTGVGMAPDKLTDLFRLDEKTSTVGTGGETGTGLGLQLCKELVEKQGGEIFVESAEGEGTAFRFTLPLHQHVNP